MTKSILQSGELLLVGVLIGVVVLWFLVMVWRPRPDPKMSLLADLLKDLPGDDEDGRRHEEDASPDGGHERPVTAGARSYDFFA